MDLLAISIDDSTVVPNDKLLFPQGQPDFSGNFHKATFYYAATCAIDTAATKVTVIEENPNAIKLGYAPILLGIGVLLVVTYTATSIVFCCTRNDYMTQKLIFEYEMNEWKRSANNRVRSILKVSPEEEYNLGRDAFEQSTCAVCLGELAGEGKIRRLKCSHIFHSECIESWIREKVIEVPKCPVCSVQLTSLQPPSAEVEREFEISFEEIEGQ